MFLLQIKLQSLSFKGLIAILRLRFQEGLAPASVEKTGVLHTANKVHVMMKGEVSVRQSFPLIHHAFQQLGDILAVQSGCFF